MTLDEQLLTLIQKRPEFREVFTLLDKMHLGDAFLCAGSIRDLVWSDLEEKPFNLMLGNLDIYYRDPNESYEQYLTRKTELNQRHSKYLWELTNISLNNPHRPDFQGKDTIADVIATFPETCSAVGICHSPATDFEFIAPYGLTDLFSEKIVPTPAYLEKNTLEAFQKRVERKKWLQNFENTTLVLP